MKIAAGGAGGRVRDVRGPEFFGDEVDNALPGPEGPGDAEERGGLGEDSVPRKSVGAADGRFVCKPAYRQPASYLVQDSSLPGVRRPGLKREKPMC